MVPIGIIFTYSAEQMIANSEATIKLFASGPIFITLGLSLIFFRGAEIKVPIEISKDRFDNFYKKANLVDKTAWFIALIIGTIISILKYF